ncbi:hypothetical protein [Litchfieldella anticariensis]|uniref:hypothetical protein n=1 Tax=Litchfieldella anticariensis TaxID=258591 RepID=UPI000427AAD7|nr:hypothetical protein [Halomonas anticariensis]
MKPADQTRQARCREREHPGADAPTEVIAMYWNKIHADYWCNEFGDEIHRYEILDDEDQCLVEYHTHRAGEHLPWSGKTYTLDEAQRQLQHSHDALMA